MQGKLQKSEGGRRKSLAEERKRTEEGGSARFRSPILFDCLPREHLPRRHREAAFYAAITDTGCGGQGRLWPRCQLVNHHHLFPQCLDGGFSFLGSHLLLFPTQPVRCPLLNIRKPKKRPPSHGGPGAADCASNQAHLQLLYEPLCFRPEVFFEC